MRLLGRVRAEALERAYPEVTVYAPSDHPVIDAVRTASGRIIDQDAYEGTVSMYHIPDLGGFLKCILPELARRRGRVGVRLPAGAGDLRGRRALADPYRRQAFAGRAREAQPPAPDSDAAGPGPAR